VARTGFLDPELSPQQLLDRQLITAVDMLTPLYAEADASSVVIQLDVGAATWSGFATTVQTPVNVAIGLGQATWDGFAPAVTVGVKVLPGVGDATWSGLAPTVQTPRNVALALGQATWDGFAPTVRVGVNVAVGVGDALWTGFAPTAQTPVAVSPGQGQGTWSGLAPTVQTPRNVLPGLGQATWAGLAPTVVATAAVVLSPGTGQALWDGFAPTVLGTPSNNSTGRRRLFRSALLLQIPRPRLVIQGFGLAPVQVRLASQWPSLLFEADGHSYGAFHVRLDGKLGLEAGARIDGRVEPLTFDLSDDELLFLAARWLDG
jgi:hypothetical protein